MPVSVGMRHDSHYVEELSKPNKTVGKIIAINLLEPNPEQPRVEIGNLEELSDSIREKGILEPILVKPDRLTGNYLIIAGERRWRAANLAGLREVPCIELDIDAQSIAEIALIENLQRKDLTVWEEADGLAALREKFGYKHEEIAKKISKSRSTVTELLSIAGIPHEIRTKCRAQNFNSKSNLLEVARQFDVNAMNGFLDNLQKPHDKNPASGDDFPRESSRAKKNKIFNDELTAKNQTDSAAVSGEDASANLFEYKSNGGEFTLNINFNIDAHDKKTVLRALKEVFDDVKSGYPV